ncbi:hypothetical protein Ocin01_14292 [Orchesella cincta]|uniref:Uncharacterized protein n=1 Tax=Orchesella cincta TaxID=48709 RepID=A0A1D2MHB5_ORCCI|nr:hypothetical protein Ocin01_14292 [Orchesella cincta]
MGACRTYIEREPTRNFRKKKGAHGKEKTGDLLPYHKPSFKNLSSCGSHGFHVPLKSFQVTVQWTLH